ncbi:MAG: AtpZ/AtpI family protein [Bdellovibrionaceae bacterium]|nr:AtpZ/AtpI family protein [Pseudobdellovibrionaceae bacterium]
MDRKFAVFTAMGFEIVGLVVAFVFIGRWVDEKFGWNGLGTAAGVGIALVGWLTHLLVLAKQIEKADVETTTEASQEQEKREE